MVLALDFQKVITYLAGYLNLDSFWGVVRTILDVGLVAFLFFQLIVLLRDSRAWQILKGVLLVIAVAVVARLVGLNTVSYIMNLILNVLPVLIVVIFQPEIRRALEGMGKGSKLKFWGRARTPEKESRAAVDQVITAAENMGAKRVGALIIFERETNLGEIIRTGTVVDADISAQLLELIFVPNTPLHDGAVVIRNNSIYAAACFLPLSTSRTLDKALGTRHRAGLGVTENSDCVAVIVSEETGKISVAENGILTHDVSEKELRDTLYSSVLGEGGVMKKRRVSAKNGRKGAEK